MRDRNKQHRWRWNRVAGAFECEKCKALKARYWSPHPPCIEIREIATKEKEEA